ncbi:phosphoglycerate dehydrogenase [Desulfotomaculum copahuensis]|uniref:D-3-phosphoglycerate dehydrogenase n=1 Tax=Desulfotomaculum copahuensis TaxID=1838280 RepID=A0A1B7LI48_9FIRM|nr:phosphoglycerate dehydrogenase [Desulfotomaculum copahuensis]OAT86090.1 phosphoglycerate dehydrogenase [Desulfotomaculum copahuensis]
MQKVLVMDGVSEEGLRPLRREEDIEVVIGHKMTEDELVRVIPEYDALIVRSATKVTPRVVEAAANLKVIGRAGVGVDNINLEAATARGILVVNAPDGNTIAATEHTIAMMLALARNIPQAVGRLKEGVWDKKAFLGVELRDKTLGIIGLGRIGSAVAKRAQALEMNVAAYDPYITEEKAAGMGVELLSLEDLFARADFITVHMPKTKESYHMIDAAALAQMKDGVRIINCARGGIIEEEALYQAMTAGKVAGAALDVFEKEPNTDSPLLSLPNFIATPHLGASTREAQLNVAVDVSDEIVAALRGKLVKNTVNIPSVNPQVLSAIRPYLGLAEKLGKFLAQLVGGRINKLEVVYSGELAKQEVASLTTAVVKGLLDPILQVNVNFVNAPVLAKNRGIQVFQAIDGEADGYASLITVKVYSDKTEKSVAGTLFGVHDPRIVMIDGYRIDTVPEGYLLYVPHLDKPRIIGPVGVLIGEHNINIAAMQVGRKEVGGRAVMMLSVDAPVPGETLQEIARIEGVLDVKMVSL